MNIIQLVIKEIKRRKLNFTLGLISVVFAVTMITGALTILDIHDLQTIEIISAKEKETRERMALLEDDYRKISKELGFNLLILPKDQNISELYANDFVSKYMPESYVDSMAASKSVLIRHLLPTLQQKITWPEKKRTIVLTGTRGEVPFLHKAPKEPMMDAVPKGSMIIGYELHKSLGLQEGDETRLLNRNFKILKCNEERGNIDDITIWINLGESQELLNKEGQINAILALKCHCADNELANVRAEVHAVLPGTQVYEKGSKILVRAEARDRAAKESKEAIDAEIQHRENMRRENENFNAILLPLVILTSAIWIVFLFVGNVRDRKSEIGILRAIGVKEKSIMSLFFLKAIIIGITGAITGYFLGIGIGSLWEGMFSLSLFNPALFLSLLTLAPVLSLAAAYIPATIAARQDPAEVLREE